MNQVIPEKILSLRNEIYRDVYNKSQWIYVKLQSLFEFASRLFLDFSLMDAEFANSNATGSEIFSYINRRYLKNDQIAILFSNLNEKANIIKHNTDPKRLQNANYDLAFVKLCFKAYNYFSLALFKQNGHLYCLDLSIITDLTGVTIVQASETKTNGKQNLLNKVPEKIAIKAEPQKRIHPIFCGAGMQDYGFQVYFHQEETTCLSAEASIYATIFGLLQRGTLVKKDNFIRQSEVQQGRILDLSKIFRYQIILLLMIRNNFVQDNTLKVVSMADSAIELQVAAESIQDYALKLALLSGIEHKPVHFFIGNEGFKLSLSDDPTADIYIVDFPSRQLDSPREIWFERPIKYSIKHLESHQEVLESFLQDFFGYQKFKPGQYEALVHMLNSSGNSLCILPTGGGKSLIFYFLAILQPGPSLIVSPTNVLIADQIRNLHTLHQVDDVQIINKDDLYQKGHFSVHHKLIFLTPAAFQHYALIYRIIDLNHARKISGIILDEVHTISQWSHDFRPDYLMLSFNLQNYADHPRLYGFTATANYRVVNDLRNQLTLNERSIVLPVELKRTDISFSYVPVASESEFIDLFKDRVRNIAYESKRKVDKMLAFTKNELKSERLVESIDEDCRYHIDVFHANAIDSYSGFVKGRKSVLVADSKMGIGINLPDIFHIMHIGLPISKAQYVQEIGRASRFGHGALSTVIYKSKESMTPQERRALDFNTSIDEILSILDALPDGNDISDAFKSILGHVENYTTAAKHVHAVYRQLASVENCIILSISVNGQDNLAIRRQQVYLYFLHKMGVIFNWYIKKQSGSSIEYLIEVEHEKNNLSTIKQKSIDYISELSQNKKVIFQIEKAIDPKEIILIMQQWYYNEFLYYHREQMLNILDFFEVNASANMTNDEIMAQLAEYFSIGIVTPDADELEIFSSLSIRELIEKSQNMQDSNLISRIEHQLENQYLTKLDMFLFFHQLYRFNHFNQSRLERIVYRIDDILWIDLMDNLFLIYRDSSDEDKLFIINAMSLRESESSIIERIYEKNSPDIIFYAYYAQTVNQNL